MSSDQDSSSSPKNPPQNAPTMSTPTSPTDTRHPLARFESSSSQDDAFGLSESYQSTDTVRRKPEQMSYGRQTTFELPFSC